MRSDLLNLGAVQKGLAAALVMAAFLGGVGLLGVMVSGEKEFYGETFINGVILVSLFCGGVVAGAKANAGGWRHGTFTGVSGGLITLVVMLALLPELFTWFEMVTRILAVSAAGAAGGIVGVNLPPLPRRDRQKQRYYG